MPQTGIIYNFTRGEKFFELTNHLGNVLVTISDKKLGVDADNNGQIDYYTADVITANDYYPFGMQMPGRTISSASYRYGFNGAEKNNEVRDSESALEFGGRSIYDPRIGRFVSIDPRWRSYPTLSPYQFAANSPIVLIDENGEGPISFRLKSFLTKESSYLTGFVYGIGDGLIESGDMAIGLYKVNIAYIPGYPYAWGNDAKRVRSEVAATTKLIFKLTTNSKVREHVFSQLKDAFGEWWDETSFSGTTGEAGYQHGKLAFDAVTLFFGVGEIKALTKGGKLAEETVIVMQEALEEAGQIGMKKGMPAWVKEGIEFENEHITGLISQGQDITRRVAFKAKDKNGKWVRAVVDAVRKNEDGSFTFIETKLRNTTSLTKNQKIVYDALSNGEAVAIGQNASDAGFKVGETVTAIVERVNKINE